ncbi:hypothetical protein JGH11_04560 [Dysgonomonas sp. Marseille-P4677]|uniref:DUF6712 family protein n=1 Tax=Dysgonomonas sp. Marseille-P4677 TaxID=2364790 RepID=UPI001911648B|nr:DUF6712 family protein [Dysgonomonas sp. Marseille-P4677]MBK5720139.1 hypothetical protein [Dysgonomonas sp. Marseille-P4677]
MAIINSIEQLRETVRVNKDAPFANFVMFLNDARDHFLLHYLGSKLIDKLESVDSSGTTDEDAKYIKILPMARRVLGPYAVMLSTDELSINTGDSGHTVTKTEKLAPASDAKIAKAANSLLERSWKNLEFLLEYLDTNISSFPEWKESKYYQNCRTKYFPSAAVFQDAGLIDIEYSRLTFEKLRQLIIRIEESEVTDFITDDIEKFIIDSTDENKQKAASLLKKVRAYIGSKVGELHTSQNTRVQRSRHNNPEYKAIIRPLYKDESDNNPNYYTTQALYWQEQIISMLPELGFGNTSGKLEWSNEGKKIFSAIT